MSSDREGEPHDPNRSNMNDSDHEASGPLNEDPGNYGFSDEEYENGESEEDVGVKDEAGECEDTPEEPPMSPQEEARAIERLIASMKDCSDVMARQNTQAVKKILERRYPEEAYRLTAAKKLRRTIKSQSSPLVAKHHNHVYKRYASVSDRLDAINQAYRTSKEVVKMEMDPAYGDKLCDNPELALRSKENNRKLNNQRNLEVKIGKKELEKQQKMSGSGDDDDDDDEEMPKPTKSKNKQTPKKTPAKASRAKVTPAKRRPTTIKEEGSSRRQLRSAGAKDEDEYQDETPSKKRRQNATSRRTTAIVANNNGGGSGQLAMHPAAPSDFSGFATSIPPYPFHLADPSSHLEHILEAHYRDLSLPRLEEILRDQGRESRSPPILAELSRRYRNIMCDLLGVNRSAASGLTYGDLRTYARAYYYPLRQKQWYSRYLTAEWPTGRADLVYSRDSTQSTHFANVLAHLRPLAIARGDLTSDGVMNPFDSLRVTTDQEDRALGLADNPLGMVEGLAAAPREDPLA